MAAGPTSFAKSMQMGRRSATELPSDARNTKAGKIDVMSETQFVSSGRTGAYPVDNTAKKLGLAKGKSGKTAVHVAVELENLPAATTMQDLIDTKDDDGRSRSS